MWRFKSVQAFLALTIQAAAPKAKSVVIVTQYFHYTRCKFALQKQGYTQISGATPAYYEARDLYSLFREFFGFYKYLIVY